MPTVVPAWEPPCSLLQTEGGREVPAPTLGWRAPDLPAREPGATDLAPPCRSTPTAPRAGHPPPRPAPARSTICSSTRSAWPTTLLVGRGRSRGAGPSTQMRSSQREPPRSPGPREATASALCGFPATRSGSTSPPSAQSPRRGTRPRETQAPTFDSEAPAGPKDRTRGRHDLGKKANETDFGDRGWPDGWNRTDILPLTKHGLGT